ncbi:VanW family protein [Thermoactinomyces mirandus]|uniref:VanW family protein n=1 Tax=Thermoactinomyces mirandus TaxID=2756294 RepID=A0A7W1XUD5_9BACL|nr:VanW family protein [Thermoactinomyces mirandus]MBA4603453.1 VanW family protein [Thermoactinomyces mirandus]
MHSPKLKLFFLLFISTLFISPPISRAVQPVINQETRLIIRFGQQEWILDLREIGFDGVDPTTLNHDALMNMFRETVVKKVNRPPRSAFYKERKVVSHELGRTVDEKKVRAWFDQIHAYVNQPVDLPVRWSKPELTTGELMQLKQKLLGSYTTYFNYRNVNRSHNIKLSAKAIDHKVLMPGEIFSFNEVVGIRTVKRGYLPARIIVKGEYSEGVGGGICQTSSTLFNSVDQAGMEIVERMSHSRRVAYVPKHRDATVSWGGPDFKFKNPLSSPVLIVAEVKKGRLSIYVYAPRSAHYFPRRIPKAPSEKESLREE